MAVGFAAAAGRMAEYALSPVPLRRAARHNVSPAVHFDLVEYGVRKRYHRDYDLDEAERARLRESKILCRYYDTIPLHAWKIIQ